MAEQSRNWGVSVSLLGSGYAAIQTAEFNDDGTPEGWYYDVWQTGIGRYATYLEALVEAEFWATDMGYIANEARMTCKCKSEDFNININPPEDKSSFDTRKSYIIAKMKANEAIREGHANGSIECPTKSLYYSWSKKEDVCTEMSTQ